MSLRIPRPAARSLLAGTAVALSLLLAGCANDAPEAESTSELVLATITPPTTFAAADMVWAYEAPYAQAVYDTLLRAEADGSVTAGLATEWSYDDSNTTLTLKLRDDVEFTDGSSFDAAVAAENLLRFRDGGSPNASLLASVSDAVAVDDTTVEVTLKAPDPGLLVALTQNAGLQESQEGADSKERQTSPVGSGPYVLNEAESVVGSSYVFDRNDAYWDEESVSYDRLEIKVYGEPTALLSAVQTKQVDVAPTLNNANVAEMEAAGFEVEWQEFNWAGLILFDRAGELNPALGDVRVRQAINYAFDRDALQEGIAKGNGTVTSQVFPTDSAAYTPELDSYYAYDPERARSLLADAGYADGLDLTLPSSELIGTQTFDAVRQQLADVGIRVTFDDVGSEFIAALTKGKYPASFMFLQQDPDWSLIQFQIAPTAAWNPLHYSDADADGLISTIQSPATPEEGTEALQSLNQLLVEEAWFAPWYRLKSSTVHSPEVAIETQAYNVYPYLWNIVPAS